MNGIVVTNRTGVNTSNPHLVTVDSSKQGGMKMYKKVYIKNDPSNYTSTYVSSGVTLARISILHTLGYAPAFQMYYYYGPKPNSPLGQGYLTPANGPIGQPGNLTAYSDRLTVTAENLPTGDDRSQFSEQPYDQWIVLVIFQESLDSTV